MRNTLLGSALASALALASIAPPLHAAEVTDGAVPSTMDDAGTHYIIGATGAHNRNLYTTIVGDLNAVTLTVQNGSILSSSSGLIGYGSTPEATGGSSVLVTGPGSKWNMPNDLSVGGNTSGNSLTIANGGAVVTRGGSIGNGGSSANNAVTITGEGST
ncbi:MAG TPA: hypothetical protein VEA63_04585, partial [Opitutus sp.]|nr:hypothetical protein [Opitutus sp.]